MIKNLNTTVFYIFLLFGISCTQDSFIEELEQAEIETPDWTEQTHGVYFPDFQTVFPSDKVNRVDITIDSEFWTKMNSDLSSNIGNSRPGPGVPPGETDFDPVWVPCDLFFENLQWYKVGIRFKGNSSLRSTYKEGLKKFSFKLDFDEFEDTYPEIENQRFYGFKQLSLKNNFDDKSFLREKVASDLFFDFGLVSPHTSFCQVYVDFGEGAQYFGLYSLVEEVDDTVIETQFENSEGNLYKPEGNGASFALGSFNFSDMNKKSNEEAADFSDVEELYSVINSTLRNTDNEQWKTQLTAILDVPVFLKWLAANTVMQNWDTYGKMTHNYLLYNNPITNKLTWIPWDNNEALQNGKQGGALSFSLNEVEENWPLICYILDDEIWMQEYESNVLDFVNELFYPERMIPMYEDYIELLSEFVVGDSGEESGYTFLNSDSDFSSATDFLKQHVSNRKTLAEEFLSEIH
jgi:spore coat protein H